MSIKTKTQLKTEADANINTNGVKSITGALHNAMLSNTFDSLVSIIDAETVNGVKTFGSFPITPLAAPTTNYQVANKKYVDDNTGSDLWEVDGTETQLKTANAIDMQTKKIINLVDPTANQDAATKKYADDLLNHNFVTLERIGNVGAMQGVASDTEYFYTTGPADASGNHLRINKYLKRTGALSVTRDLSFPTDGTAVSQINGIHVEINTTTFASSLLYVGAMNYNDTPKVSFIKVFNCSDLTYVTEHAVTRGSSVAGWTEGCSYREDAGVGSWWICWDDSNYCTKYDASWSWVADYELTYESESTEPTDHKYNSIVWVNDYLYCNKHELSTVGDSETCDIYSWNGSSFDEVERLVVPNTGYTNQGMAKEPGLNIMWWAERNYPAVYAAPYRNNVVITSLPYY